MTAQTVLFIGAPETPAAAFAQRLQADLPEVRLLATDQRSEAMVLAPQADAMIGHHFQFDDAIVTAAPRLRWIQSLTTGTDAIMKIGCLPPEVTVTSMRGIHGPQMSELVFLHMLALSRDFPRMQRNQAAALWERWPQPLLWGKTVVVVGVGAISEALAPRCQAFGMRVFGVSNSSRVPDGFDGVFHRQEIARAAALADFLVLVVPYSPETESLVNAEVLAAMKPQAFLINVARGGVLDEQALVAALRAGQLAGAALDVFRQQPLPADDPLWREPGVIISPLVGGMSDVYLDQAYPVVLRNLQSFVNGDCAGMQNVVARP